MDIWRQAVRSLLLNPLRAGLTTLGMVIGVAAIVGLVSMGQSVSANIKSQVNSLGPTLLVITPGTAKAHGVFIRGSSLQVLTMADAQAIQTQDQAVTLTAPVVQGQVEIAAGALNNSTQMIGSTGGYAVVRNLTLAQGRFFSNTDVASGNRVVVVGSVVAQEMFPRQDPIGQTLDLNGLPFTVIGELVSTGSVGFQNQDNQVIVPISTAMGEIMGTQYVSAIFATAKDVPSIPLATAEITQTLHYANGLPPGASNNFTVSAQSQFSSLLQRIMGVLTVLLAAIASISLVVAGIGIMNVMLMTVMERTQEIGLRMAIGAPKGTILAQFLAEAAVLSGAGGLLGVAIGWGASGGLATAFHIPWVFPPVLPVGGMLFSLLIGVLFGVYPARKASKLRPIEALRHD